MLSVHTDKGFILDGTTFNPQHNPALKAPDADARTFFCFLSQSLSQVSVGQLN